MPMFKDKMPKAEGKQSMPLLNGIDVYAKEVACNLLNKYPANNRDDIRCQFKDCLDKAFDNEIKDMAERIRKFNTR